LALRSADTKAKVVTPMIGGVFFLLLISSWQKTLVNKVTEEIAQVWRYLITNTVKYHEVSGDSHRDWRRKDMRYVVSNCLF
jgi:hypothetical protein